MNQPGPICVRPLTGPHRYRMPTTRRRAPCLDQPGYGSWRQMMARCGDPRSSSFADYGGRGIAVCDRWRDSFVAFIDDMGPPPSRDHSIDRIDNSKGYEPSNCRWATKAEQNRNTRRIRWLEHDGERLCVAEWARRTGMGWKTIERRLTSGWSVADALTRPVQPRSR